MNRRSTVFRDRYGDLRPGAAALIFMAVAVVLIGSIVFTANAVAKSQARSACGAFSVNTGRVTKFVSYTYWKWDCLTPSADGRWVPTSALREVGQ